MIPGIWRSCNCGGQPLGSAARVGFRWVFCGVWGCPGVHSRSCSPSCIRSAPAGDASKLHCHRWVSSKRENWGGFGGPCWPQGVLLHLIATNRGRCALQLWLCTTRGAVAYGIFGGPRRSSWVSLQFAHCTQPLGGAALGRVRGAPHCNGGC